VVCVMVLQYGVVLCVVVCIERWDVEVCREVCNRVMGCDV